MHKTSIGQQLKAESFTFISPLERFGHCRVEVVDKLKDFLLQLQSACETAALDQAADQNAEPNLNLIQPRASLGVKINRIR